MPTADDLLDAVEAPKSTADELLDSAVADTVSPKDNSDTLEWNPSFTERLRTSSLGRSLFGPTQTEREGMAGGTSGSQMGFAEIPETMLKFTSLPPPFKKAVDFAVNPVIDAEAELFSQPLKLISPEAQKSAAALGKGIGRGIEEFATTVPLAPIPGMTSGKAGLAALGVFGTQFLAEQPEVYQQFKNAVDKGDVSGAAQIAVQNGLGGALLAFGAKHGIKELKNESLRKEIENASKIPITEGVLEPEVRAPVGESAPLRQQGEAPEIRIPTRQAETPVEAADTLKELSKDAATELTDDKTVSDEQAVADFAKLEQERVAATQVAEKEVVPVQEEQPPAPSEPPVSQATPAKTRDWDAYYEDLVGDLDSFSPARNTGQVDYEMQDVAQRFVDYAKGDNSGKPLDKLVSDFSKSDDATASQVKKLRASVKNLMESEPPATVKPTEIVEKGQIAKPAEAGENGPGVVEAVTPLEPESGTPIKPRLGKGGPGAAVSGEPGTYSNIQSLADQIRVSSDPSKSIDEQISTMDKAKSKLADVKDSISKSFANVVAAKDALWDAYTTRKPYTDEKRAAGRWFRALQQSDHEARDLAKQITKAVPSKIRREAITNWIQTEGDDSVLQQRAEQSQGSLRQGYEAARNLTPKEKEIGSLIREYYDRQLQRGISEGILKDGLENYITQIWKKENPITKRLVSELVTSKLPPNFKYARKRIFDSYFEGEQAGFKPNKDAGLLVVNYDQAFNRTLAARNYIKDLHEGVGSDGRPLVEVSGNGKIVGEDEGKPKILIQPRARPEELTGYRTIDHPALRGWKWVTKTPEGVPVMIKGDMLIHPEAYDKLKNRLSVSWLRQHPATRAILGAQTQLKNTMLSLSGFHQVQETLHALGHRVNPTNLEHVDFSEPVTRALAEHGLQLADYNAENTFGEGLVGGGLLTKIPALGPKLHAYNEWLFQDYIPRLKLTMAKEALARNRERYKNLNEDQLMELTASQANAAFGELPYKYWGRNQTFQDTLRTFLLAPDFLEARTRFVGQAARPFGREQMVALGLLAATQYITARVVNQILDKDPHWERENMFRIVSGNHAYSLRTIPGDIIHLISDPRSFGFHRLSPGSRTAMEAFTGRDDRGVKRDIAEQAKDLVGSAVPLSLRVRTGQNMWESFGNSLGVQNQRWDAVQTLNNRIEKFKSDNKIIDPHETIYDRDKDAFYKLRVAIDNGDVDKSKQEYLALLKNVPKERIEQHFSLSLSRPLTGSRVNDEKFLKSLNPLGKQEYKEAKDLRLARYKFFEHLARTTKP